MLVVAPDTDADGVAPLIARLRGAVGADPIAFGTDCIDVTVSAGGATHVEGDDVEALVRRAEYALHRATSPPPIGGDRSHPHKPPPE
jgi:PleD family two-component response regulator